MGSRPGGRTLWEGREEEKFLSGWGKNEVGLTCPPMREGLALRVSKKKRKRVLENGGGGPGLGVGMGVGEDR